MSSTTRRRRGATRGSVAVAVVGAALALAACGGSTTSSPRAAVPATTGNPPSMDATNLSAEPQIAKGSGTPPTTLQVHDLVVGTGPAATPASTATIAYKGAIYATGEVFDKSWGKAASQPGVPAGQAQFPLARVVPGFSQGIGGTTGVAPMKVGGRREILIPPDLGYGPSGEPAAGISGTDTLIFVVDLTALS